MFKTFFTATILYNNVVAFCLDYNIILNVSVLFSHFIFPSYCLYAMYCSSGNINWPCMFKLFFFLLKKFSVKCTCSDIFGGFTKWLKCILNWTIAFPKRYRIQKQSSPWRSLSTAQERSWFLNSFCKKSVAHKVHVWNEGCFFRPWTIQNVVLLANQLYSMCHYYTLCWLIKI